LSIEVRQYDPKDVKLTFFFTPITGFASGSFITVKRNKSTWTTVVGVSGEVTRIKSTDYSGTIEFSLEQAADSNKELSLMRYVDELLHMGIGPVEVTDGKSVYVSAQAWLDGAPQADFAADAGTRKWKLHCATLDMFEGGLD